MPFVGRRVDNSIYGCWEVKQWSDQEFLPDAHPDIVAFRAPKPPIDLSDLDNIEKGIKTLALCIAQLHGLTVPQIKALFKQKWDTLQ